MELTENDLLIQQLRNRIAELEAAPITQEKAVAYLQETGWMQDHDRVLGDGRCRWYDTCPMAEAEAEAEHEHTD